MRFSQMTHWYKDHIRFLVKEESSTDFDDYHAANLWVSIYM